ncbi:MAG: ABC transporter permease [Peptococcaceae bacterium]|jgi:putative ABC transport system permease protein|nr:ABC transporter permease [Peptococcaceae bacterium]MDH7524921.1 ABC transporter permease [Peptococcaceae bacterium]
MSFLEVLKMAFAAMRGNKLRSLLTALGIIFGVGAVIAMISIGQGASKDVSDRISNMGSNMIIVSPMRGTRLSLDDAQELLERVPSVTNAMPYVSFSVTAKWSNQTYDTSVQGVTEDYTVIRSAGIASGRLFTRDEVSNRELVAVVGQTVVKELFSGKSPLGEKIMIKGKSFLVVGVLAAKGSSMGRDSDDTILIPVTVAQRITGSTQVNSIYLKAASADKAALAVAHITSIFNQKFKRENTVRVTSQDELLETINTTTRTFTIMLGAIAGISLLVGGIGIMNIMLVSVTERTREIGIRKALGAKRKNIMWQFLVESVFLSVSGGILGVFFGIGVSKAVSYLAKWTTVISFAAVFVSFLFALAVGLFFGVYPAYKAANLDPIVALRHE